MTSGAQPPDEFARLLAWAYRGEVSGEAMFGALVDAWPDDGRDEDLRVLAELERRMALALAPLLRRHAVDGGDDERSRATGRRNAAPIAEQSWDDFLEQFAPATDRALARYRELQRLAPDRNPVLDDLIAHEEALQAYAASEMRGERDRALEPVRAVITRLSISAAATG